MKKIQTVILLLLLSISPFILMCYITQPIRAEFSEEIIGTFDGLEPGESLEYKLWIPQDLINWIKDPETLESFLTVFNTTFWESLLEGLLGLNITELYIGLKGIFDFIDQILNLRLKFDIIEVIQPNTTDLYPYGNVKALLSILHLGINETYGLLTLLGIVPPSLSLEDFTMNYEYYSTNLVMDIDALTLLAGQPFYPEHPDLPFPTSPDNNITWVHYQPDDVNPYPLTKFTDFPDLTLHVNSTNPPAAILLEHNGTGIFTTQSFDFGIDHTFYFNDVNTTAVDYCHYWSYRFFINDTLGYNITTIWFTVHKNGPVGALPIIMANNFNYWAGYFDGFLTLLDSLLGLFIGYDIIQDFEFILGQSYTTSNGVQIQQHDAIHAYIDVDMGTITDILLRELLGLDDLDLEAIFLTLDNYTDWLECFHAAPLNIEVWFEEPHGFALRADLNINITHILNKYELFLVRLLYMMSAPPELIGNITAALDWLKIGNVGIGTELTWYEEIPEPTPFIIPWWVWLIIGVAVAASVGFLLGYQYRMRVGLFARRVYITLK